MNRFAELFSPPLLRVERMQWGVELYRWTEQGEIADPDPADIEHDTVEIEEHPLAGLDVCSVVAIERRLHPYRVAALPKQVTQNAAAPLLLGLAHGVQVLA